MNAPTETPDYVGIERRMRQEMRTSIMAMGVPSDKAAEITDLAFHGCNRAMSALLDAIQVASSPIVQVNATLLAASLIDIRLKQARDALPNVATSMGAKVYNGTLNFGGQPS